MMFGGGIFGMTNSGKLNFVGKVGVDEWIGDLIGLALNCLSHVLRTLNL